MPTASPHKQDTTAYEPLLVPQEESRATVASNGESSPAYRAIEHLLCKEYRVDSADDLRVVAENSTRCVNMLCCWFRCCGVRTFEVSKGKVRLAEDGSGNYEVSDRASTQG